jgi:hypothetical protein
VLDSAELIAGTDPINPGSLLKLEARTAENELLLSWPSFIGRTYAIEFKLAFTNSAPWQVLTNNLRGDGSLLEAQDSLKAGASSFYRVVVAKN